MSRIDQAQTNNKTFLGRYWHEHNVLSRLFSHHDGLKVLSFGCSTGEELLSLRALMPGAQIFGCDVDWHSLQKARALLGEKATIFDSDANLISAYGPYDIIVCNSVLLRPTTEADGRKRGIDASFWSDLVSMLDESLKPGGVVQIINSNIPFRHHHCSEFYQPAHSPLLFGCNFVDLFGLNGEHYCSGVSGYAWSSHITRHMGEEHWSALTPDDIETIHWRKRGGPSPLDPPANEILPNLRKSNILATGSTSYRPSLGKNDKRPATYVELDLEWQASADSVRIQRTQKRVWFDGKTIYDRVVKIELEGQTANAFIESTLGRRSTTITSHAQMNPTPISVSNF